MPRSNHQEARMQSTTAQRSGMALNLKAGHRCKHVAVNGRALCGAPTLGGDGVNTSAAAFQDAERRHLLCMRCRATTAYRALRAFWS